MKRIFALIFTLLAAATVSARQSYDVSQNWKFFTYDESNAVTVNLPHTWNNDALGGRADYFRGTGNYLRYIDMLPEWQGKRIFIRFGGSNAVTDLLINGSHAGQHRGGSNAFLFEITDLVTFSGRNLFWVMVNNSQMIDILPTAGADNAYGGIFRSVEIIVTEKNIINPNLNGADGVTVVTTEVGEHSVRGTVQVDLLTDNVRTSEVEVEFVTPDGRVVARQSGKARNEGGKSVANVTFNINRPEFWQATENPALYDVNVRLSVDNVVCDSVTVKTGFRNFTYTSEGLSLNGKPFMVRGVIMHRDRSLVATAVSADNVADDLDIISEMGANTIYVVGGSMGREFYDECDRRGLVVITGIPFTGSTILNYKGFYNTESFRNNGIQQLDETICQLRNHPSIMAWNLFTEMEIRGESPIPYLRTLNSRAKQLDPSRLTIGLSNQDGDINFITDLVVWSHTFGWIEGQPEDITIWQRQMHTHPDWSTLRSAVAYRCGGNILDQSEVLEKPVASGNIHPERWQTHFHDTYLSSLSADSLFWGSFVNCMFDFGSVNTIGGDGTGINDSGIVTFDRQTRKDSYYIYKAAWNTSEPFIHIAEKRWKRRREATQTLTIYSNLPSVELLVNGTPIEAVEGVGGKFVWENISLMPGKNTIEAFGEGLSDKATIEVLTNTIIL